MVTQIDQLDIFDFDDTLFRSPGNTKENHELYEKETGIPWIISKSDSKKLSEKFKKTIRPRSGWYGRKETLEHPFVPSPVPEHMWVKEVVEQFHESKLRSETETVMMTGRHAGIQSSVLRILHEGGLVESVLRNNKYYKIDSLVQCLFRGQNGPNVPARVRPEDSTLEWKIWIIEKYMDYLPNVKTINIWEDRVEHVDAFKSLNEITDLTINVTHVL